MSTRTTFITKKSWAYYERHCRQKIKHISMKAALEHVKRMKIVAPMEEFTWYVCAFCSKLHVGHSKSVPKPENKEEE